MELARIFAANGHRVVLAARRADRLNELAREITAAGGAAPIVIPCDLEKADACDAIEAALAAEGVEVEYLVNNAGFGMFGHAIKRDRNDQLGMIAVNIGALTDLTLPRTAKNIEFLRALPKLERLSFKEDPNNGFRPDKTVAEFWREFDANPK
jgi:short-subunit dehydrogenase